MRNRIYRIGYDQVNRHELLERLELRECLLVEHKQLSTGLSEWELDLPPEDERHSILVRYESKPGEWITFTGLYEILERNPIPWIELPIEYHLFGVELIPGNIRREEAPQARIPAKTKLQVAAIRGETVFVTVPGHPSRKYEMSLNHVRFARDFPTELELKVQVFAFPPRPDIFVDWLLEEGRKKGIVLLPTGTRVERSAFQVWDQLRQELDISESAALIAIKQALLVMERAGLDTEFPNLKQEVSDLSAMTDAERDAFYSYHTVKAAMSAVAALLTTQPRDPLQDLLLMDIMFEQQLNRRRE